MQESTPSVLTERPRRYFRFYYVTLRLLGAGWWHHPDERDMNNFPANYIPYSVSTQLCIWTFLALETLDTLFASEYNGRFMFSIARVITHNLTFVKIYLFLVKNRDLQEIIRTIEVGMYDYYQNDKTNRKTIRAVKIMTISYIVVCCSAIAYSVTIGVVRDLRWKSTLKDLNINETIPERILAQPVHIPWSIQGDISFQCTFVLVTMVLCWFCVMLMMFDTLIAAVIVHLSGQFEVLQEAFVTFYERAIAELTSGKPALSCKSEADDIGDDTALAKYTELEIYRALEKQLHQCIRQHQLLIGCVEKFGNFYNYAFLAQLLSSSGALCVIMVQVSTDVTSVKSISFVNSVTFLIATVMQLALQCITGSELTYQAGRVSTAALQSRWEALPPRLRRQLALVTARAQRPLRLRAGGYFVMNHDCFFSIIKAAYSYYAVLRQKTME